MSGASDPRKSAVRRGTCPSSLASTCGFAPRARAMGRLRLPQTEAASAAFRCAPDTRVGWEARLGSLRAV
eukprot:13109710-Alexandrium_andersonii.AAC.1